MNILEIVIMVVLVVIIVGGVSIPPDIHSLVGSVPGIIIILFILGISYFRRIRND